MATDLMIVVVEGDASRSGRVRVAFPIEPMPGDVIRLAEQLEGLEGRYHVRRREIEGGTGVGVVILVVERWDR